MNIDIVKIHFKDKELGEHSTYKYLPFEYCCNALKNFEHIDICDDYDSFGWGEIYDTDNDIVPHFALRIEEPQPWEDGTWPYYYTINYCPFCGEKININLKDEIDKSKLYTALVNSRDAFKEAFNETDSVKTQKRLEEKIREVTRKINDMWEFGVYNDS